MRTLARVVATLCLVPTVLAQDELAASLSRSPGRREAWTAAIARAPAPQRTAVEYLLAGMPTRDLEAMDPDRLLEEVALAFEARRAASWGATLPEDVFLDAVLPYANATEARDPWRRDLSEICRPIVEGCRSPGEAARRLNETIFGKLGVRYSTARRRPDQSPKESIETGLASCTGLSILLVDACRSVAVPARIAGIPRWTDKEGNHTWVEIWDGGWHFAGAAEPDPAGLDRGWFAGDAARARKGDPLHAIYAATWRPGGVLFPLAWDPGQDYVRAEDVTDRYARPVGGEARLMVRVTGGEGGPRVAARVLLVDEADARTVGEGLSRDESADTNDYLTFDVARGRTYEVVAEVGGRRASSTVRIGDAGDSIVRLALGEGAPPGDDRGAGELARSFAGWFAAAPDERAGWTFPPSVAATDPEALRRLAWEAYRAAPIHAAAKADWEARRVRSDRFESAYTVKEVGTRPAGGWGLFIAMHGGGGAPKEVNDDQWRIMQGYYRDQPDVGGYKYVAIRAPTDAWNGFYTDYVYPLIENLIRAFLLLGDVDPDKVFAMGYSHGGYGAFAIGPKLPHRFAAVHASAAAPTDGQTAARNLRNTVFTYMIGEHDTTYGRLERCRRFEAEIRALRGERTDVYPVAMEYQPGFGHGGLPDRDKIRSMYPAVRNPVPRELTWLLTDGVIRDHFWLSVPDAAAGREVSASCRDNVVAIEARGIPRLTIWLDPRLVDFARPVTVRAGERTEERRLTPDAAALCESLLARGDPRLAFAARIDVDLTR